MGVCCIIGMMLPQKPILKFYTDPSHTESSYRIARFWKHVAKGEASECWPWTAALRVDGYGVLATRLGYFGIKTTLTSHRVAWVLTHMQDIPEGMVIDHLCGNKACCNPDHLECVTQTINVERYHETCNPESTCKRGHPTQRGKRCRECNRLRVAAWIAAHPEKRREQLHRSDLKRGKTGRTARSANYRLFRLPIFVPAVTSMIVASRAGGSAPG
jgi:hypothetical protein